MYIYMIKQEKNNYWDTFDSAVVYAKTEESAKNMRPGPWKDPDIEKDWALPEDVTVILLGKAIKDSKQGVICASFNAG